MIGSILQNLPNESIQYNLHNRDLVPYTYSNSATSILSRLHTTVNFRRIETNLNPRFISHFLSLTYLIVKALYLDKYSKNTWNKKTCSAEHFCAQVHYSEIAFFALFSHGITTILYIYKTMEQVEQMEQYWGILFI